MRKTLAILAAAALCALLIHCPTAGQATGPAAAATAAATSQASITVELPLPTQPSLATRPASQPSAAAGGAAPAPVFELGDKPVTLDLNLPLVRRLLLDQGDLVAASLRLRVAAAPKNAQDITLRCEAKQAGLEFHTAVKLTDALRDRTLEVPGLAMLLSGALASAQDVSVSLWLQSPAGAQPLEVYAPQQMKAGEAQPDLPRLVVTVRKHESHFLFDWPVKPTDGVYCTVRDGHLYYGDQRLRTWGVCRTASGNPLQPQRVKKMGFNAVRVWGPRGVYTERTIKTGTVDAEAMGSFDRYIAEMKRQGMWVMAPCLMSNPCGLGTKELLADDGWLAKETGADAADWAAWKEAVTSAPATHKLCEYFDERLQAIRMRHAANFLNHRNPYTGKRYSEEECIFMYEIWNENGFLKWCLEGSPEKKAISGWPKYFQDKLASRWNDYLTGKYTDDAGLKAAWGKLDEGESLAARSVRLGPLYGQRHNYAKARGDDFVRFMIGLVDGWNQKFRDFCRSQAPSPKVGVAVVPFSFDTQYRNTIPWLWADAQGDVMCFGMYENRMQSALDRPPGINVVDSSTVAGKPVVLYEVNRGHPDPHRTEYPAQLAALGGWQDWDGIFWHYFQEPRGLPRPSEDEDYLVQPIWSSSPHDTDDLWIETDPAMCGATAVAGQAFLHGAVSPAPSPEVVKVGQAGVFSYDLFDGLPLRNATFARGAKVQFVDDPRLVVDPPLPAASQPTTSLAGKDELTQASYVVAAQADKAIAAGKEILYDWPNGRLIVDTPTFKACVGKAPAADNPLRFSDSSGLADVKSSSGYATIMLASGDGKPLAQSDRIYAVAVHDAVNTGFRMEDKAWPWGFIHPKDRKNAVLQEGHPPVQVDRIGYSLLPPRGSGNFNATAYDFALRRLSGQRQLLPFASEGWVAMPQGDAWMLVLTPARK
jgi:hypothetical protein